MLMHDIKYTQNSTQRRNTCSNRVWISNCRNVGLLHYAYNGIIKSV